MTTQLLAGRAPCAFPEESREEMQPIHVCYLLGCLKSAGTERQALELMKNLDSWRFKVSLILFESSGIENIPSIVSSRLVLDVPQESSKWLNGLAGWAAGVARMYSHFAAWKPDVVHAFLAGPSILGVIPARLARVPIFLGSRRSMPTAYRRERWLASLGDTLAFKLAHLNLANCAAVEREMVSVGDCPREKCLTLHNGIDTVRFHPGAPADWRGALGWDASHVVFGLIANFYAYKRHADFLAAAALILQDCPHARFVMVGSDYGTKKAVMDEIVSRRLDREVKILASVTQPEEIFAGLDVLVCASDTEGCSNVLLEAMASAKPVIATSVGGNPEIVLNGETGFLVPPRSPQAIAHAAARLIRDPDLRLAFGIKSRQRIVEHFSLNSMVRAHEQLYTRLTAKLRHSPK
jgi:glycosyltransferase involved in cell wall biosynthesis